MIFSELYSAYYNAVAEVLKRALDHPLKDNELRAVIEQYAFGESILNIFPALKEERWQLLKPDGTTVIENTPSMPLTILEKRWLKSIALDPRIRLFGDMEPEFPDVEPLFTPDDYIVFDKYGDGDNFQDEAYIAIFRLIMDAIRNKYPLQIELETRKGNPISHVMMPEYLEYSEKDDKFRLIGSGSRFGSTINLGRIISCRPCESSFEIPCEKRNQARPGSVIFELYDRRNALERVLLHFAHFEKKAEKIGGNQYRVTLCYDKEDETEILIRILSFGPMVKVTAPSHFVGLIKERLIRQKSCEL